MRIRFESIRWAVLALEMLAFGSPAIGAELVRVATFLPHVEDALARLPAEKVVVVAAVRRSMHEPARPRREFVLADPPFVRRWQGTRCLSAPNHRQSPETTRMPRWAARPSCWS